MRRFIFAFFIAMPIGAGADDAGWVVLGGDDISAALTGRIIEYDTARQDFRASGRTLYHAGQDSWGYWAVRGDQYCSMWPPSDLWACYDMTRKGEAVRFIGTSGETTEGVLRPITQ